MPLSDATPICLPPEVNVMAPVGVAPLALVTVAVMVTEPVDATEVALACRARDADARTGEPAVPGRHQVIGVDGTESAGLVIALACRIAVRSGDAVARARTAGHGDDVVAGGDIVKHAGSGLGEGVEARVDVADARRRPERRWTPDSD